MQPYLVLNMMVTCNAEWGSAFPAGAVLLMLVPLLLLVGLLATEVMQTCLS